MLSWEDINLVKALVGRFDTTGDELVRGVSSFHWVMDMNPSDELIEGSTLPDRTGVGRARCALPELYF